MPPQETFTTPIQPTYTPPPQNPIQPIQPPPPPQPPQYQPAPHHSRFIVPIIVLILVIFAFGGVVYAYIQGVGPFSSSTYTEDNLFSGLLSKFADIKSSTYTISGSLNVENRDADAVPYVPKGDRAKLDTAYKHDYTRVQNISQILSKISNLQYAHKPIPTSLKNLKAIQDPSYYYSTPFDIVDPVSGKEYSYAVTEGGTNFSLKVTLETDEAIQALKKYDSYSYNNDAAHLKVTDKTIEFTKADTSRYMYISQRLPQPFLVEWTEALRSMPADVSGLAAATVSAEVKDQALPEWTFNINAEGTMGDLSYKINADALKKDDTYYVKINNIPSLFFFTNELANIKGKWVKIGPAPARDPNAPYEYRGEIGSLQDGLPEMEKSYRENKAKLRDLLKKAVEIADDVKLASFKNKPSHETVDGRRLTRYDLTLNKEAIIPFYTRLKAEVEQNENLIIFRDFFNDPTMLDYLKGPEFDDTFDYLNKNTQFTLWVDDKGFPAIVQEAVRLVPPDTATQLQGKQIKVLLKLVLSDINKPITIIAPKDAVPVEQIIEDAKKNSPYGDLNF